MSEYNELYQQVILEHNKKPRNFGTIEAPTHTALGKNPLCGDEFAVFLDVDDTGVIRDVKFQGNGCAISKSSASLMTTNVKGKTRAEAVLLKDAFQGMLIGTPEPAQLDRLGRLNIFEGVKEYPVRVKCATLAWHALDAALSGEQSTTTE